jgi:hypothetical protein
MTIAFRHPSTANFFQYWDKLPKKNLVPDRSDFDPLKIVKLMPQIVMVEYHESNAPSFRLVGTEIVDRLGFDPSRKSYLSFMDQKLTAVFWSVSQAILSTPCGGYFRVKVKSAHGYTFDLDFLDLPMSNEQSGSQIILAHMAEIAVADSASQSETQILDINSVGWIDIGSGCPASMTY